MHEIITFIEHPDFGARGVWICLILLAIGIWLLALGGSWLVTGGLGLAKQLNIKTVIVGLTIIAFSTSAPELAFNVFAAIEGSGEISIGNIFGSNIANLTLVLGVGALIHNKVLKKNSTPIGKNFIYKEGLWLLGATIGISLITTAILLGGNTSEDWISLGWPIGVLIFLFFILFFWKIIVKNDSSKQLEVDGVNEATSCSLPKAIWLLLGGFILLILGGKSAEIGAVSVARIMGISEMFIGVTIVAIATSLPELVTTIVAAKRDEAALVWGNIVGSNLFNILFVLPITVVTAAVAGKGHIAIPSNYEPWFYMTVMLGVTIFAWGAMKKGSDITNNEAKQFVGFCVLFLVGAIIWKSIAT